MCKYSLAQEKFGGFRKVKEKAAFAKLSERKICFHIIWQQEKYCQVQKSPGDIEGEMFDKSIQAEVEKSLGWLPERHFNSLNAAKEFTFTF